MPGYVPGTNQNEVVVHGTPGVSDPGVPVVIVNEASGQTSTVIAKEDGSFTSWVDGQAADFISATFISLNGARIYVPVNRQIFDDGSVGLYSQGGSLQSAERDSHAHEIQAEFDHRRGTAEPAWGRSADQRHGGGLGAEFEYFGRCPDVTRAGEFPG
jgi:hypothetical protein